MEVIKWLSSIASSKMHPNIPSFSRCCGKQQSAKIFPAAAQKVMWLGTDGASGAGLTLHHHSLGPYG
jgi:hypothetical protein